MRSILNNKTHINKIMQISEENITKKRLNNVYILYGSGEQSRSSDYKYFNTFGKDLAGKFC